MIKGINEGYLSKPELAKALGGQYGITISDMGIRRYTERYKKFFTDKTIKHRIEYYNPSSINKLKSIYQFINEKKYDQKKVRKKLVKKYGKPSNKTPLEPANISNVDIMNEIKITQKQIQDLSNIIMRENINITEEERVHIKESLMIISSI